MSPELAGKDVTFRKANRYQEESGKDQLEIE
jgi:hypothetical protein